MFEDDLTSKPTSAPASAQPLLVTLGPTPLNGAMVGLILIGCVGTLLGVILIGIGAATPDSYDIATETSSQAGIPMMLWGAVFLNIGFFGLFGALVAKASRQ